MKTSKIEKALIIDAYSEHPKSNLTPEKLEAAGWKKDTNGNEYIDITHNDPIEEGIFDVEETEGGYNIPDTTELLERAFVVVLTQVDTILSNTDSEKIKGILSQVKNWEIVVSQDYDDEGKPKISTHWRIVRQEANTLPKKELKTLGANVTKEFIEKVSFQVDFVLNMIAPVVEEVDAPIEAPVETLPEPVETSVVETTESPIIPEAVPPSLPKKKQKKRVSLVEKKDPSKYELEKVMKQYIPLPKETLTMEEGQYVEHMQGLFQTFVTGEIQELLSTRGTTYQDDLTVDSIRWIDSLPLEQRLQLIEKKLPEYLDILKKYPATGERTPRDVLLNTPDMGWDAYSFEYFIIRSYIQAGKHVEVVHLFEQLKSANSKVPRSKASHPESTTYDVWSTVTKFTDSIIYSLLAHPTKLEGYDRAIRDMYKAYLLKSFKEQMPVYAAAYAHLDYEARFDIIKKMFNIGNRAVAEELFNHPDTGVQNLRNIFENYMTLFKYFGKGDMQAIREALIEYIAYGMSDKNKKEIRYYMGRPKFFQTFAGGALLLKVPKI